VNERQKVEEVKRSEHTLRRLMKILTSKQTAGFTARTQMSTMTRKYNDEAFSEPVGLEEDVRHIFKTEVIERESEQYETNQAAAKVKGKGPVLDVALLHNEHMLGSALQSRKWQLIGVS